MDTSFYLSAFEQAACGLDTRLLSQKGLEVEVGVYTAQVSALATGFITLAPLIDMLLEQKKAPASSRRGG